MEWKMFVGTLEFSKSTGYFERIWKRFLNDVTYKKKNNKHMIIMAVGVKYIL